MNPESGIVCMEIWMDVIYKILYKSITLTQQPAAMKNIPRESFYDPVIYNPHRTRTHSTLRLRLQSQYLHRYHYHTVITATTSRSFSVVRHLSDMRAVIGIGNFYVAHRHHPWFDSHLPIWLGFSDPI